MLFMGHGRCLSCSSAGNDRIGTACDLLLYDLLQLIVIYFSVFLKRRNQRNASSFKTAMLIFSFLQSYLPSVNAHDKQSVHIPHRFSPPYQRKKKG